MTRKLPLIPTIVVALHVGMPARRPPRGAGMPDRLTPRDDLPDGHQDFG